MRRRRSASRCRCTRWRWRPVSSASQSTSSSRRSSAARCAGIHRRGWEQREPALLQNRKDRCGDHGAHRDPARVAALDGAPGLAQVSDTVDDPRDVPRPLALLAVRNARRAEPRAHRHGLRDRGRRGDRTRHPARALALGPAVGDAAHRVLACDAAARAAADLNRPAAFDRQQAEGRVHRILLSVPGLAQHDRRCPRNRSGADRDRARVQRAAARADPQARPARGGATDRRGYANQPLARRDHDGPVRVLLEHERRRLRPAHLEEHVRLQADVGGDRVDRPARLPAQRPVPDRRAPAARMAPGLARGGACLMAILEINDLGKVYGTGARATHALADLSFSVEDGEFVCVVGPSGCGKTTLLKCVAGLLRPTRGDIVLRGTRVTGSPEELAVVFQEYGRSLMPWMSVRNNVVLPLRHKKLSRRECDRLVENALEAVGLTRFIDHYPWQLSGGMQQRVAIARALAYQPTILLMDEPFASVDAQTRGELEDLVLRVWDEYGVTILFVTHDIDESVYLADRVIVLTHAPTEVKEIVQVDLSRPRDQITTKELPEFVHLRGHVYRLIKRELPVPV